MKKCISYHGIDWEVEYRWYGDAGTNVEIVSIRTDADVCDHLLESTLDGLYEELEASFKN